MRATARHPPTPPPAAPRSAGTSAETPSALDAPLSELGYEQATPAKRDQLAGEIERGGAPTRDTVRDTEANQQGRRDLERIQNDPNLSPERS
ncbi:MAG TPA: hypothetical protein VHN14_08050 [Kofleriaceae bacterium]|jgi:hypothetical protein|nr:hypothetical protein [Kofleriaceae bacterium]